MTCLMNWPKGEAAQPVLHIGDATSCGRQKTKQGQVLRCTFVEPLAHVMLLAFF